MSVSSSPGGLGRLLYRIVLLSPRKGALEDDQGFHLQGKPLDQKHSQSSKNLWKKTKHTAENCK